MHKCVLYRQTRRKNSMLFNMERDFLCVCTPETSVSARANTFSGFSAAVPAGSRCVAPKLFWRLIRATKCLPLPNWFTILNTMFGRLSRTLMNAALRRWPLSPGRAGRTHLPRTTRHLSLKRPNARRTCWAVRLSDGRWRSCGNIFLSKRSSPRSALKRFGPFCMKRRSNCDVLKHGKSATTRSLTLKKLIRRFVNQPAANGPTISYDEFGPLEVRPQPGQVWCETDHPKRLPATYTRTQGVRHWLSFYDVHTKKLWGYMRPRKRHQEFLAVLKLLRKKYPKDQRIHLILDNFSPHRKEKVLRYCRKNNIHLIWTPTNASWLNPIECQFTHVKEFVIRGTDYQNHQELNTFLNKYVRYRNKQTQQK